MRAPRVYCIVMLMHGSKSSVFHEEVWVLSFSSLRCLSWAPQTHVLLRTPSGWFLLTGELATPTPSCLPWLLMPRSVFDDCCASSNLLTPVHSSRSTVRSTTGAAEAWVRNADSANGDRTNADQCYHRAQVPASHLHSLSHPSISQRRSAR
jgi:hypothetical protein